MGCCGLGLGIGVRSPLQLEALRMVAHSCLEKPQVIGAILFAGEAKVP